MIANLDTMTREELIAEVHAERSRKKAVLDSLLALRSYYNLDERVVAAKAIRAAMEAFFEQCPNVEASALRRGVEAALDQAVAHFTAEAQRAKP